jgi:hypothetical protein
VKCHEKIDITFAKNPLLETHRLKRWSTWSYILFADPLSVKKTMESISIKLADKKPSISANIIYLMPSVIFPRLDTIASVKSQAIIMLINTDMAIAIFLRINNPSLSSGELTLNA